MIVVILFLIVFINFLLQSCVLPYFPIAGAIGNTSIIIIVCVSLFLRRSSGRLMGLCMGLLEDIIFSPVIGARTLAYLAVGYFADSVKRSYKTESMTETMILVAVATVGFNILYFLVQMIFLDGASLVLFLRKKLLKEVIYNCVLLIPIKHILYKVFTARPIRFMEN